MSKRSEIDIEYAFPPGWVELPVGTSKKLHGDKWLEQWAAQRARELLPGRAPDLVRRRADDLVSLTTGCRARHDMSGCAYFPDPDEGLVAMLDVHSYAPDKHHPVITLDLLEEIYAARSPETVGDIETSRVDLPSGPAVRVRTRRIEGQDEAGQGTLSEGVTYAIRPPAFESAAVATMTWTSLHFGDELAEMAEAIVKTIRVMAMD